MLPHAAILNSGMNKIISMLVDWNLVYFSQWKRVISTKPLSFSPRPIIMRNLNYLWTGKESDFRTTIRTGMQCMKKLNVHVKLNQCKQTRFTSLTNIGKHSKWGKSILKTRKKVCLHSFNFRCMFNFFMHCRNLIAICQRTL